MMKALKKIVLSFVESDIMFDVALKKPV